MKKSRLQTSLKIALILLMTGCTTTQDPSVPADPNVPVNPDTPDEDEPANRGEEALVLKGDDGVTPSFVSFNEETKLYEVKLTIKSGYQLVSVTVKDKSNNDIEYSAKGENYNAIFFYDVAKGKITIEAKSNPVAEISDEKWEALASLGAKGKTYYATQYLNGVEMYSVYGRVTDDFAIRKAIYGGRTYTTYDYVCVKRDVEMGEATITLNYLASEYIDENNQLAYDYTGALFSDDSYYGDTSCIDFLYKLMEPEEKKTQLQTLKDNYSWSLDEQGNTIFEYIDDPTTTSIYEEIGYAFFSTYEPLNTIGYDSCPTYRIVVSPENKVTSFTMGLHGFTVGETYSADNDVYFKFEDWPYEEITHTSLSPLPSKTVSDTMKEDFAVLDTLTNNNYTVHVSSDSLCYEGLPYAYGSLNDSYSGDIYYGQLDGRDCAYSSIPVFDSPSVTANEYDGIYAFYTDKVGTAVAGYYAIGDNSANVDASTTSIYDTRISGATRKYFEMSPSSISKDFFTDNGNHIYTFNVIKEDVYSTLLNQVLKQYLIPSLDVAVGSYHSALGFYTRYQSNEIQKITIDLSSYATDKTFKMTFDIIQRFTNTSTSYNLSVDFVYSNIGKTSLESYATKLNSIISAFNTQYGSSN